MRAERVAEAERVGRPRRRAYAAKVGWMPSASALASEARVLGVVDRLRLVDQHDRDVVARPRSAACRRGL